MDDLKTQFEQHLAGIGFEANASREVIFEKMRQRMGEQRFKGFSAILKGEPTASSQEEMYKLIKDIVEGNLLRSLDSGASLEASYALYRASASRMVPGARVIELGCWTGGLASFIAARHPECLVAGVDFQQQIIDACTAHYQLTNLRFLKWNYRFAKPEGLEPADVLICSLGVVHHTANNDRLFDPAEIRRSAEYVKQRDHAYGYFGLWRTAAKEGASLYTVLRLQRFPRFLAWIDAAMEARWTPLIDRMWAIDIKSEKTPLPAVIFEAVKSSAPLSEGALLECWASLERRSAVISKTDGAAALATFRMLGNRSVLAKREYRRDGLLIGDVIGWASDFGYVFTHDAVSEFRLLIVTKTKAKQLAAGASVNGSDTPISDEGTFQIPALLSATSARANVSPFASSFFVGPST